MSLKGVENVIRERLGIDPAALGPSVLPSAIESRMNATGTRQANAYQNLLTTDPRELEAISAELVVAESWFFRGGLALFQSLAHFLAERSNRRPPGFRVRVLSLPCSTGEEPYSLAIALHLSGVQPTAYHVDAVDLSRAHVDRARTGSFSAFAFREPGIDIRADFFRQSDSHHWTALTSLKRSIHFHVGNIVDPNFLANEPPYDLILCRNLFIYLTVDGRSKAIANLERLLAADGYLCLTPAEADRLAPGRFVPEGPIEHGLYRRVASPGPGSGVKLPSSASKRKARSSTPFNPVPKAEPSSSSDSVLGPPESKDAPRSTVGRIEEKQATTPDTDPLERARTLANAGRLIEAREVCEESIRSRVELPEAYALIGVIHQAQGHAAEAIQAFRKALYLEPGHVEALTHMIVLLSARGDAPQAAAMQKRLDKLRAPGES